ncbi:MAG: TIGR02453 family protein [Sphingobacteriaceae bacterium]|nr:TIGR02453 family protein [Sphingobacteriaceae bacterium]
MMNFATLEAFLKGLAQNNHKAWFDEHRVEYQQLRADFMAFVDALIKEAAQVDSQLATLEAKNCIFRINRDVRFSANKNPYKTNFSAYLSKGGKKFPGAGYYFHFEPGAAFLAAGIWMPEAPLLKQIRQEIDYGWSDFERIVNRAEEQGLRFEGEQLSRPPKGYDEENQAIAFLKYKSFILSEPFQMQSNDLKNHFAKRIGQLKPFVDFLNQAVDHQA